MSSPMAPSGRDDGDSSRQQAMYTTPSSSHSHAAPSLHQAETPDSQVVASLRAVLANDERPRSKSESWYDWSSRFFSSKRVEKNSASTTRVERDRTTSSSASIIGFFEPSEADQGEPQPHSLPSESGNNHYDAFKAPVKFNAVKGRKMSAIPTTFVVPNHASATAAEDGMARRDSDPSTPVPPASRRSSHSESESLGTVARRGAIASSTSTDGTGNAAAESSQSTVVAQELEPRKQSRNDSADLAPIQEQNMSLIDQSPR